MCTAIVLLFDGEKCVLLLCMWKPAFLKSDHIYDPYLDYKGIVKVDFNCCRGFTEPFTYCFTFDNFSMVINKLL